MGLLRSVMIYYGQPWRRARLTQFYSQFLGPKALAFDVGAHVGNRIQIWRELGATVVAIEPQPACFELLNGWYGQDAQVTLVDAAVGAESGQEKLHISKRTPTVTTMSQEWKSAVQQVDSFSNVAWDEEISVNVCTLDQLIDQHGIPAFCKIDVEGYEFEVLKGLSHPIPAFSLEYIPATPAISLACIEQLMRIGNYEFNWSEGESQRLQNNTWVSVGEIRRFVEQLRPDDNSGDLYARQRTI